MTRSTKSEPIAWLPAADFSDEAYRKIEDLWSLLIQAVPNFRTTFVQPNPKGHLETVAGVLIERETGHNRGITIHLQAARRFQGLADAHGLEGLSFRRGHPTSTIWSKNMDGLPTSKLAANHMLSGLLQLVGLRPNVGFRVSCETNQCQATLDRIVVHSGAWNIEDNSDIWYLN